MATNGATLAPIYNRLNSVPEYHPFTADTFSDWSMEAGDMIRISRDGTNYDSPVHSSSLTWKGQSQINVSSDGAESRDSISKATKKKYGRGGSGYRNDSHIWQELLDDYNGLYSYFEVTASRMYVHFDGMYDGLSSTFEVTRSRLAADFQGKYDGLSSFFEVTRSRLAADFQGKYDGLASHFEVTRSRLSADFSSKYDGLASHFEVTRSLFNVQLYNAQTELASSIRAQAGRIDMVVEGTGPNSYIKPAKIQMGIDAADGSSKIELSADHVVIDAELVTSKVTADIVQSRIGSINMLQTKGISASGNLTVSGTTQVGGALYASSLHLGSADSSKNVSYGLVGGKVELVSGTNNYRIIGYDFNGREVTFMGTFSRATALSGTWSGGVFTVSASPQGNTTNTGIMDVPNGDVTWNGNTASFPVKANRDGGETVYNTGKTLRIDASGRDAASGSASGRSGSSYDWTFRITRGDGTSKNLTIDCSAIYSDARSGYTQGNFRLADITLQGSADTVYKEMSSGGTNYYTAGSTTTYYNSGSNYSYYKGDGGYYVAQGSSVSVTRQGASRTVTIQGSAGPKLYHYGSKQLYYKSGNYYYSAANADWYYVSTSSVAVQYYRAGSSLTLYNAGTAATYYNAGTQGVYARGNIVTGTNRGSSVSVTPINENSRKHLVSTTRYTAGTRYTSTYYTKS